MEVYVLDSLFRLTSVVDTYNTFIWTERMRRIGDFELHTAPTLENRNLFLTGTRLAIPGSKRVMMVETVEDKTDQQDAKILVVKGRSLEAVLEQRLAMADLTDLTTNPKWEITGFPKDIATQLFHDICVTGILDAGDIISGITEGSIFPADTIDEPTDSVTYSIEPKTLYEAMTTLCDAFSMGFRLVRNPTTSALYFDVYMGCDRTSNQTTFPAVIFSPDLDNLQSTTKLTTIATYANAAYVVSPVGHEIVYPVDVDPTVSGLDRRVIFVKADDITDVSPTVASTKMIQRGMEALAQNRQFTVLDGELSQTNSYIYGVTYNLGDTVELQDEDGSTNVMQVTEQIFVSDAQGDRTYPTLEIGSFVTPGSWLDQGPTLVWADMTTQHWDEEP